MNYIIDNKTILIFAIILMIFIVFMILIVLQFNAYQSCSSCKYTPETKIEKMSQENQIEQPKTIRNIPEAALYESPGLIQSYNPMNVDIIRQYDIRKAFDPLEQPVRRVARHEIHPLHLKRLIDFPTRGYPDNFTQIGILVKEGDITKKDDNRILRLFGRQEFPGSNNYEYYTAVNSGNDQIKMPIDIKRRELYDDDIVHIKEIGGEYRVHLHKYDAPKYYPDIIY